MLEPCVSTLAAVIVAALAGRSTESTKASAIQLQAVDINALQKPMEFTRRQFSVGAGPAGALALLNATSGFAATTKGNEDMQNPPKGKAFWPNGARLAISISLMFEGGGQPISGAGGPITEPILDGLPDLPTNAFFAYGHYEGIPRALNLFVSTTSRLRVS